MDLNKDHALLIKIKAIIHSPQADLFRQFVDILFRQLEEDEQESLTMEDIEAIRRAETAIAQGEYYTLEELRQELDL